MEIGTPESLKIAAEILLEDAEDCWGIRRKLNLKAAAKHMTAAAEKLEENNSENKIGFEFKPNR